MFVVTQGYLSALLIVQGYGVSATNALIAFTLATAAVPYPVDSSLGEIDPAAATALANDAALGEVVPTLAIVLPIDTVPSAIAPTKATVIA